MQAMPDKQYEQDDASQESMARLNALGVALSAKRKEAVEFRRTSGIEEIWDEDQAFYDGLDEPEVGRYVKGTTIYDSPRERTRKDTAGNSTVFVNITQPYVDMYASRVGDMLLPNDDRQFAAVPTPIPELDEYANSDQLYNAPDGQQLKASEVVKQLREKAKEIAQRSEDRIWDWLVEAQWHREIRKVIHDDARIGVGILKGPVPEVRKYKRIDRGLNGETVINMVTELVPVSKRIKAENFFPDPACGENIHNGGYAWEKDFLTKRQLSALKGGDYLDDQIDLCLKEGPGGAEDPKDEREKKVYEVWYYYGDLTAEDMTAAGCECEEDVPAIITMVNDRVIKAAVSPLDSGEFPFDVLATRPKDGTWAGTSIARQIRVPQKMLNSATRVMLKNGGLSAMPIWFMRKDGIYPADGTLDYSLTPGKGFLVDSSTDMRTVQDCVHFEFIPNLQERFMAIVQYALELAERLTNMPLMMQGQQGTATETVGGMQILQANSNSVMRYAAKQFDDLITEPHIGRYYEWLLIHGDDPEEKGDATIDARGSSVLFERDAQNQAILQMAAIVKDPAFGIDPKRWIIEALKAQKLDPERFRFSEEEQAEQQQQEQPGDPRIEGQIQVAQIRSEGEINKATMVQQSDMAELQFKAEEAERQRQHDKEMKTLDFEIAKMQQLDKGKIDITRDAMKLNVQKELSEKSFEVQKPPTEPAQHAPDGESYQQ